MRDAKDLAILIQTLIKSTIGSMKLSNYIYGEVINDEPLEIKIDQKLTLNKMQIILTRNVTEWEEEIDIDWSSVMHSHGFDGEGSVQEGNTNLKGRYKIMHKTKLKTGEKVLLAQIEGGQQYVVIDRV